MPVYTRAGIPAAVLSFVFYLNRNNIFFTKLNFVGNIIPKTGITIRVLTYIVPVYKYGRVHINAIKLYDETFSFFRCRDSKYFAIPSCTSGCKTATYLADCSRT